ncbi:MAG: DUF2304 domain-containing protein [Burkholderiales bacterium]|nr:DUF2304 domain-containing protein [Anaerolineae bacterium]
MLDRAMLFGIAAAVVMLVFVLELVRSRRLKEEYSLLWLATALVLLVLSLSRPLLDKLAETVGIFYPPSALFLVALSFLLFILLHFSTVLTRLANENKQAAQELALLRQELAQTQRALTHQHHGDDENHQQSADIQ